MDDFSDYIVYVDESGDHGMGSADEAFPVFCLAFCIIKKTDYHDGIVPEFQKFEFYFWGHDAVVLHERDIRKSKGPFAFLLTDKALREAFYDRLNQLMEEADFSILPVVVDKRKLKEKYAKPWNPYETALYLCLERLLAFLIEKKQAGKKIHVVFESRGQREDDELELEFRRICDNDSSWGWKKLDFQQVTFEPLFMKKGMNSTGLQLADLTARPIAIHYMRPEQKNRAYEILQNKLWREKYFP